jgi:hypothetical protein
MIILNEIRYIVHPINRRRYVIPFMWGIKCVNRSNKNEIVPKMSIFLLKSIIVSVFVRTKCLIYNKICIFIEVCRYTNMSILHGCSNL